MTQKNKVYVLGSVNIDMSISVDKIPAEGETKSGHNFIKNIGGKGTNQAVSAASLGCETKFIAAVGNDLFGKDAIASIKSKNIDVSSMMIENGGTGMAFITRTNRDNRIILHEGANHKINLEKVLKLVNGNEGDVLIVQYEIPFEVVKNGLKKAKSRGMITLLNPAPSRYLDTSIYKYVDYLILNQTECEILSGIYPKHVEDVKLASKYFFDHGIHKLIVTMGSKGSIYTTKDEVIEVNAYKVKAIDSTGAGDAYVGGIAYGIANHLSISETIKIASAAGANACLHEGVENAMGSYQDILKIMEAGK